MPAKKVFISAVSKELKSYRTLVEQSLQKKGNIIPIFEELFDLDDDTIEQRLRNYIKECEAVILLVGFQYGAEPHTVIKGYPRCSWTQLEYHLAKDEGKKIYRFLTTEQTPVDPIVNESSELQQLQREYREFVSSDMDYREFNSKEALRAEIAELKFPWEPKESIHKINNLPYRSLGELFVGRGDFLDKIREKFETGKNVVGVLTMQTIHGMGGIGKTRTAVEYAWKHQDEYDALLMIQADTSANLKANLAGLVGPMVLDIKEAQNTSDQEVQVQASLRWLATHKKWFLIIDNVDDEETRKEVEQLLNQFSHGQIVITSRLSKWGTGVDKLELNVLSTEDSVAFLNQRTEQERKKQTTDTEDVQSLAERLDGLALGLEQAAAYIAEKNISYKQYLQRWETKKEKVLTWFDPEISKYPRSLAITWETSFEQLSDPARKLMEMLCWLAPDPIPMWLFEGTQQEEYLEKILGEEFDEAHTQLLRYSLAKKVGLEEGEDPQLQVHRLVQESTRQKLRSKGLAFPGNSKQELSPYIHPLFELLDLSAPAENPFDIRSWSFWTPLANHIETLCHFADEQQIANPTDLWMNDLALFYNTKALYQQAEPLMRRALEIDEASYGRDHSLVAIDLSNLAELLRVTGRFDEAEPLMRRALKIDEASYRPDHPNVATSLNNLAKLLQATNRLAEAEPLIRRALEIDEASYGPDHPHVATSLSNLASLLQDTNRLAEAEPLKRRALEIDEASYGPDHPHVAIGLSNLAELLRDTGRFDEAEPLMRRAIEIYQASYGPDHPHVAIGLSNLASLLQDTNRLAEAEPLMRRAIEIYQASYGPDHPHVATGLNNLAELLRDTGRFDEAEPLMRRAFEINQASYGPNHPHVAIGLGNLAELLRDTGRFDEAEPLMRRAFEINQASYGRDHSLVAIGLSNLALLLQATNRLAEAEPLSARAVKILLAFQTQTGFMHPDTQAVVGVYKSILKGLGHTPEEIPKIMQDKFGITD